MNDQKEYYTVNEIAERYSVSRPTVYTWIEKGLPHSIRREIGRKPCTVICADDVDEFMRPGIVSASEAFK